MYYNKRYPRYIMAYVLGISYKMPKRHLGFIVQGDRKFWEPFHRCMYDIRDELEFEET